MYDIVDVLRASPAAVLARVVDLHGFSSRFDSDVAALGEGRISGGVLGGLVDERIRSAQAPSLLQISVADDDAIETGLSCGGSARILVQSAGDLPDRLWSLLHAREPLLLATSLAADSLGRTEVYTADQITAADVRWPGATRLFGRGSAVTAVVEQTLLAALWPTRRLVVVGSGLIAEALVVLAGHLHWAPSIQPDATGIGALGRADALVVLSHDRAVDGPALQQALHGSVGYIGALGSRRTQAERRDWLAAAGVDDLRRVHGPAGLDIGAFTPFEIAVSIVAEILAVRTGSVAGSISARPGPVHS